MKAEKGGELVGSEGATQSTEATYFKILGGGLPRSFKNREQVTICMDCFVGAN